MAKLLIVVGCVGLVLVGGSCSGSGEDRGASLHGLETTPCYGLAAMALQDLSVALSSGDAERIPALLAGNGTLDLAGFKYASDGALIEARAEQIEVRHAADSRQLVSGMRGARLAVDIRSAPGAPGHPIAATDGVLGLETTWRAVGGFVRTGWSASELTGSGKVAFDCATARFSRILLGSPAAVR